MAYNANEMKKKSGIYWMTDFFWAGNYLIRSNCFRMPFLTFQDDIIVVDKNRPKTGSHGNTAVFIRLNLQLENEHISNWISSL
jgi:hypothetical protein